MELEQLKRNLPDYLQRLGVDLRKAARNNTVCPICNGGHNSGCFHYYEDTARVHCYSCGFDGDMFDLIAKEKGISNGEAIQEAKRMYGYETAPASQSRPKQSSFQAEKAPETDFADFFRKAAAANDFEYLRQRGISEATQKRFMIGYVPNWKPPTAPKAPESPRCIIPTSRTSYLARDTRSNLTEQQKPYSKQNCGRKPIFNLAALDRNTAIFVTEGEIDALSIEEAGGAAVGLGSTSKCRAFIEELKKRPKHNVFVLCLDNDEPGKKAQAQLAADLEALQIPCFNGAECFEKYGKDPNEWLLTDPESFRYGISYLKAEAEAMAPAPDTADYGTEYRAAELLDYFRTIEAQPVGLEAKTGFASLDDKLHGGLHEGLYIIGAISSLGKTTFTLQLADQIASTGQDVLFFSLEMSKFELMAKSISRNTYIATDKQKDSSGHFIARDTQQIMNNRRYAKFSERERAAINEAIKLYSLQAENLYIYEGRYQGERLTVQHIKTIANQHKETTGNTPIIFVDYLQILGPADPRQSDKQNTDTAVFELKEISRNLKTAVFAISSFNRDNYTEPVNMASFKESGAVEYSSDILFGLQYQGMDYQPGESEKNRSQRLRDLMDNIYTKKERKEPIPVELKCLKNRNGYQFTLQFTMQAAFNYFEESKSSTGAFTANRQKPVI